MFSVLVKQKVSHNGISSNQRIMNISANRHSYRPRVSRKVQRYMLLSLIIITGIIFLVYIGKDHLVNDRTYKSGVFYFGKFADEEKSALPSIDTRKPAGPTGGTLNFIHSMDIRDGAQNRRAKGSENDVTMYNDDDTEESNNGRGNVRSQVVHNEIKTWRIKSYTNDESDTYHKGIANDVPVDINNKPTVKLQQEQNEIEGSVGRSVLTHSDVFKKASNQRELMESSHIVNEENTLETRNTYGTQDTKGRQSKANNRQDEADNTRDDVNVNNSQDEADNNRDDVNVNNSQDEADNTRDDVNANNSQNEADNIRDDTNVNNSQDEADNTRDDANVNNSQDEADNIRDDTNVNNSQDEADNTSNDANVSKGDNNNYMNKVDVVSEKETAGNDGDVQNEGNMYKSSTLVLLLTYLRSGSTLTADIIQQVPGVFYTYEPLKPYLQSHKIKRPEDLGYFSMNGICSIFNLTCRPASQRSEERDVIINDIVRYFNCDLDHFARPFLWSPYGTSVRQYKTCIKTFAKFKTTNTICLKHCTNAAKSLKTIRLSMDMVEILMQKVTNLKVIHLLRDPRGMIKSRKNGGFVKNTMNLTTVAQSVCRRFERDIEIAIELRRRYPERLKTYLYEQIAEHPELASASLFKFLSMTPPDNFTTWLHNHTAAGNQSSYYGTSRPNSTVTANAWRRTLPYSDVIKIDNECLSYYKYTGILKAKSAKLLKNLNIPLRSPSPLFGNFL